MFQLDELLLMSLRNVFKQLDYELGKREEAAAVLLTTAPC